MRHIVAKASVRYITGNGTGSCGGTGSNRGNRRTGQHCAVVGGNGAKCTPDKTKTTAGGNVGTTVYNSVPYTLPALRPPPPSPESAREAIRISMPIELPVWATFRPREER